MDWMYANCSTTAQRGALDWRHRFRDAVAPLFDELYQSVSSGDEARIVIETCSKDDYRESLDKELAVLAGEEIWRAIEVTSEMGYGQPVIYEAGGTRQLIVWHPTALTSLNPETGAVYWDQPWEVRESISVATPARGGDYLLVSQFYRGSMMMRLSADRPEATLLWQGTGRDSLPNQTDGLHAMITTPVIIGDHVYGVGSYGELRGLDARTGERLWMSTEMTPQARWGGASIVQHGDRYFVHNDDGDLIIAQFTPTGYVEQSRTKLIEPTTAAGYGPGRFFDRVVSWAHPAFANRHVVQRNDNEIVRASLAAADY